MCFALQFAETNHKILVSSDKVGLVTFQTCFVESFHYTVIVNSFGPVLGWLLLKTSYQIKLVEFY